MKLSIIIPVFNEKHTIAKILEKACGASLPGSIAREVLIVDDGSTDGTADVLREIQTDRCVRILTLGRNRGKAGALLAGIAASKGEYVLFQDADMEYDPVHYEQLLSPILAGEASVVFGSRFLGTIRLMHPVIRFANIFSTWTVNVLYGTALTDVNTGFKVIPREHFDKIHISSDRFGGEAEITARLLRMKKPVLEVPIHYTARSRKNGKKMNGLHAIHIFICFLFYRVA